MIAILLVIFYVFLPSITNAESPKFDLYLTKGVLALEAKDYPAAIENLKEALKEDPDNYTANLCYGITLCETGRETECEIYLKKALKLEPLSPRANLELGIFYFKKGLYEESNDYFETVRKTSTDIDITRIADNYIRIIEEKRKTLAPIKKYWSINLTTGMQYDSNVILQNSGGTLPEGISRKSDWRGVVYFDGRYIPSVTSNLMIGPSYSFYQSIHSKLHDFNVQQHLPGLNIKYYSKKGPDISFEYRFEYTTVGGDEYVYSNSFSPMINFKEGNGFSTLLTYRYHIKDFKNSDLFKENTERDGFNHLLGITQFYNVRNFSIYAGYTFDSDNTDKKYWSYQGHSIDAGVNAKLLYGVELSLTGKYYKKYYRKDFPGEDRKRKELNIIYSLELAKNLTNNINVIIGWLYDATYSNIKVFDYRRNITTILLQVVL